MRQPAAVLLDIDGCIVGGVGREALPGAVDAVAALRARYPLRLVTNTTSRTRGWLFETLSRAGFGISEEEIVTPTMLARQVLSSRAQSRGILIADKSCSEDLSWYEALPPERWEDAVSVLVASEARERKVAELGPAVLALRAGAKLYTLQQNRIFERDGAALTDLGPIAAFLGYAANVDWENLGKPSPLLFSTLAEQLGCTLAELMMVGDDAEFDVAGALLAGVGQAVLVRTGKYRAGDESGIDPAPTAVVDDIASLSRSLVS